MFDFVEKNAIIKIDMGGNLFLQISTKGNINMSEAEIRKFIKEQRKKEVRQMLVNKEEERKKKIYSRFLIKLGKFK